MARRYWDLTEAGRGVGIRRSARTLATDYGLTARQWRVAEAAAERVAHYRAWYADADSDRAYSYWSADELVEAELAGAPFLVRKRVLDVACSLAEERGVDMTAANAWREGR